ncbi:MAG: hypothetical protein MZU95_16150 [Desulfomicrobium escambiense]|nr:hypothetical protein [Desulfomicrobium escambiense]
MLVHPVVSAAYEPIITQLAAGLMSDTTAPTAVCTLPELDRYRRSTVPRHLVAVGESAYEAARRAFPQARVWPILVQDRPAGVDRGVSRFVAPALVIAELHTLSPTIETLVFVYRATVPDTVVQQARAAAQAQGLAWEAIAVDDLRAAARAIERVRQQATPTRAVWLHRDVLALNPDILIPPLVRRSWEIGFPVASDDADSVERGLLLALTPDYRALGRMLATWPTQEPAPGWRDIDTVRRVLNRRTARAIGAARHPAEETHFDVIFD